MNDILDSGRKLTPEEEIDLGLAILDSDEMRARMPETGWPPRVIAAVCNRRPEEIHTVIHQIIRKLFIQSRQPINQTKN